MRGYIATSTFLNYKYTIILIVSENFTSFFHLPEEQFT